MKNDTLYNLAQGIIMKKLRIFLNFLFPVFYPLELLDLLKIINTADNHYS